ncbi:expressed unknown protein [Seminavis robusta]|uniref:Mitochondrial import inner membrane translocase subunit TIM50 n=1 Tax=Seminavis robusta TaxID=568900 RepID=A0A9N8HGE8_9STRA|nr:expressed unknown protein [Seminavis robusta]|eukprot:Sro481_g151610.1 n/a (267) ;mRNA; r:38571-39442
MKRNNNKSKTKTQQQISREQRLGLVFDIDGTLILETENTAEEIVLRPGSMEFLQWCQQRGHALALWTAASDFHLDRCVKTICPLVAPHDDKPCQGAKCNKTFEFAWCHSKLKQQEQTKLTFDVSQLQYTYACPCRYTKDLKKVWKAARCAKGKQHRMFGRKERTLMIENTPQQCIDNFGNAIYVPTYDDPASASFTAEQEMWERLKKFLVQELEQAPDIREVRKCRRLHGFTESGRPHACFQQDWWYADDDDEEAKGDGTYSDDGT